MKPATRKPKLPNYLSYPLTYSEVSNALMDVPFSDRIELNFTRQLSATEFREIIETKEPYPILIAQFVRWDKMMSHGDEGWIREYHDGVWKLRVYPCDREMRARVNAELKQNALPLVKSWYLKKRPDSWYWGRKELVMWLEPEPLAVSAKLKSSSR